MLTSAGPCDSSGITSGAYLLDMSNAWRWVFSDDGSECQNAGPSCQINMRYAIADQSPEPSRLVVVTDRPM